MLLGGVVTLSTSRAHDQQQSNSADAGNPIVLAKGPHLLLDDYLIARSEGVKRVVVPPQRFLDGPIVTGSPDHQNWQPFFTVLYDPAAQAEKRFRMWYNVDTTLATDNGSAKPATWNRPTASTGRGPISGSTR
jgi:hypothetical protein